MSRSPVLSLRFPDRPVAFHTSSPPLPFIITHPAPRSSSSVALPSTIQYLQPHQPLLCFIFTTTTTTSHHPIIVYLTTSLFTTTTSIPHYPNTVYLTVTRSHSSFTIFLSFCLSSFVAPHLQSNILYDISFSLTNTSFTFGESARFIFNALLRANGLPPITSSTSNCSHFIPTTSSSAQKFTWLTFLLSSSWFAVTCTEITSAGEQFH